MSMLLHFRIPGLLRSIGACSRTCSSVATGSNVMPSEELVTAQPTYNLAPFVNHSKSLQKLFHFGVELSRWEKDGHLDLALSITDFQKQVVPTIEFFSKRIDKKMVAKVLTEAPTLLQIQNQVLESRLQYLETNGFTHNQICKIITKEGAWLTFSIDEVDNRLGYFQKTFSLKSKQVRALAVRDPSLILWIGVPSQTRETLFAVKELMGFTKPEIRGLLMSNSELFKQPHEEKILEMFDFLHNQVGFSHVLIQRLSKCLLGDIVTARERYAYLQFIGRADFDPRKPNYISPLALAIDSDEDFCRLSAKTSENTYNQFLKTL